MQPANCYYVVAIAHNNFFLYVAVEPRYDHLDTSATVTMKPQGQSNRPRWFSVSRWLGDIVLGAVMQFVAGIDAYKGFRSRVSFAAQVVE